MSEFIIKGNRVGNQYVGDGQSHHFIQLPSPNDAPPLEDHDHPLGTTFESFLARRRRPKAPCSASAHGIYLGYRRRESAAYAGRLFDHLSRHFGPGSVFMDVQGGIRHGQDFARAISSALDACQAVLVVIGKDWASCTGHDGRRRLEDPEDWVRFEVASALRRDVLVVPVLVGGACLPEPASLPEELRALCGRNACELSDLRWAFDVGELVKDLEQVVVVRPPPKGSAKSSPGAVESDQP